MLANDRGAVTAEFMMLTPAVISVVALLLAGFQLGLTSIALERDAAWLSRSWGYGNKTTEYKDYQVRSWREGHLACLSLTKAGIVKLQAQHCVIAAGS